MKPKAAALATIALLAAALAALPAPSAFTFVLLGDRTGETQPGIWERVLQDATASNPAFILSIGDVIQGVDDATAESQWQQFAATLTPYRKFPLYLTPGNHDIWSQKSEDLYRKYSTRALHYSFDYGSAHFTILDNSRADDLAAPELAYLEADLKAHAAAAPKFVLMHRPSWLAGAALRNPTAPLHQLAKRYNVQYWLAGHVHQLIHADFDGIAYYAAPSAGGHLRLTRKYEDGWFFGWTKVEVKGSEATFEVHELEGRITALKDWALAGLMAR
jgi:3',5'-cyclic-AMP phosphodiesterase